MSDQLLPDWELQGVDEQRMKMLALLLRDPNPIHYDAEAVRALGLGDRPVNQGPANLAYILTMVRNAFPGYLLGRVHARFLGSVYAGDDVIAGGRVRAASRAAPGDAVTCDVWLQRRGHGRVVEGTVTLHRCSDTAAPSDEGANR